MAPPVGEILRAVILFTKKSKRHGIILLQKLFSKIFGNFATKRKKIVLMGEDNYIQIYGGITNEKNISIIFNTDLYVRACSL